MAVWMGPNELLQLISNLAVASPETDIVEMFVRDVNARIAPVRLVRCPPDEPAGDHQFRLGTDTLTLDVLQMEGPLHQVPMDVHIALANAATALGAILVVRNQQRILAEKNRMLLERVEYQRKQLANAEAFNQEFMSGIQDIFISVDRNFSIVGWNPAAERYSGKSFEEVLHHNLWEVLPEFRTAEIETALIETETTRHPSTFQQALSLPNRELHFQVTVYPSSQGFFIFAQDQTRIFLQERENKAFLEKLRHAQKLESLGMLAGGIAHDFNNLLLGILGNVSLAMMDLPHDSTPYQCLADIEQAAKRAADLAGQMLAYSGRGRYVVERVDASQLIQEMSNLIKATVPRIVSMEYRLEPECPLFVGDRSQIHQALMNVVINAAEAISGEGIIRIQTSPVALTRQDLATCFLTEELEPGPYTRITVQDNGCGMDEYTLSRIFDPFFSTKFTGRGLGLAAVLGIVRAHRGTVRVTSSPGAGTTFEMFFPADLGESTGETLQMSDSGRFSATWNGSGIVLFVDDEETVRNVGKRLLSRMGFEVILATDGVEAVETFARYGQTIGLVVMDMTMPRMDGREALEHIRRIRPDVKVILSTGYSERDVATSFLTRNFDAFIQKPYNYKELKDVVRSVLAGSGAETP